MAIPGLPGFSLPGLDASTTTPQPTISRPPRTEHLPAGSELRFEVPSTSTYTVRLLSGTAEIFGTELAPNQTYTFGGGAGASADPSGGSGGSGGTGTGAGYKGAIYTWHGCALEIRGSGEVESEYVGSETDFMREWLALHGMAESMRADAATNTGADPPRFLVVGPEATGKSSLAKCLAAWALKMGRVPTVVNLDPLEGLLSLPGSLSAVAVGSLLDVEKGWGSAPVSGPMANPVKTPLVYQYPFASPEECGRVFKPLVTRAALAVTSKMEEEVAVKVGGLVVDSSAAMCNAKGGYENLVHVVGEFSVNTVVVLGSERVYNDLQRRFANTKPGEDEVVVLKVAKSSGAVNRDEGFMRALRKEQIRSYFFGDAGAPLNPHGQWWDFADLNIWQAVDPMAAQRKLNFMPGMDDEDDPGFGGSQGLGTYEKVSPSQAMINAIMAIKFCAGNAGQEAVRDSCVMGWVYVAEVDEVRKKVRFLAPHPARWGDKALVMGSWPEPVGDLVA